jgi:uncharacterized membrane protein
MIGLPEGFSVAALISDYFTVSSGVVVCLVVLFIAGVIRQGLDHLS